jgi:Fe-S-cluster containining protein
MNPIASSPLPAGDFSVWIDEMLGAINGERSSDVPCDGCTACCTSSQFIHIGPDEIDTLAHIPAELLFPAPGLPRRHVLMGYDERGHCPMLVDDQCSIYDHRPTTCRTYDCRVFSAAGLEPADHDKAEIATRVRRWKFSFPTDSDRDRHAAVLAAANYLRDHAEVLPSGAATTETQLAVLAVQAHAVFVGRSYDPSPENVRVELNRFQNSARSKPAGGANA